MGAACVGGSGQGLKIEFAVKMLPGVSVSDGLIEPGWSASKRVQSHGCWPVPYIASLSLGSLSALITCQLASHRASDPKEKRWKA